MPEPPIADDEILYRRIPNVWYTGDPEQPIAPEAFTPKQHDANGISLWRARFKSAQATALQHARPGKRYYVAAIRAVRIRQLGLEVVASPSEGGEGHASIPRMNYENRKLPETKEYARRLAFELPHEILGPFDAPGPAD